MALGYVLFIPLLLLSGLGIDVTSGLTNPRYLEIAYVTFYMIAIFYAYGVSIVIEVILKKMHFLRHTK
jgi:hypothetical protein